VHLPEKYGGGGLGLRELGPVSKEMILNFVAEHSLGLPRSY
jgi:hypothetical protein